MVLCSVRYESQFLILVRWGLKVFVYPTLTELMWWVRRKVSKDFQDHPQKLANSFQHTCLLFFIAICYFHVALNILISNQEQKQNSRGSCNASKNLFLLLCNILVSLGKNTRPLFICGMCCFLKSGSRFCNSCSRENFFFVFHFSFSKFHSNVC